MKQILVTGANGQLGRELQGLSPNYPEYRFFFTDVDKLDITRIVNIEDFLEKHKIDLIINCAAYNFVDEAEKEAEKAFLINGIAVKYLAQLAEKNNIFFIHISTDYVFDGMNHVPYHESDQPNPLSTYARSKHDGETQVINTLEKAVILRTSWLYSVYGNNFVKTILKYAWQKKHLKVVCDQIGSPTYSTNLAETIINLIPYSREIDDLKILHYSNEGVASWYDFAKAIVDISGIDCTIVPVLSREYPQAAPRPFYSVMDKSSIKSLLNIDIPYWRDSLRECLSKMD